MAVQARIGLVLAVELPKRFLHDHAFAWIARVEWAIDVGKFGDDSRSLIVFLRDGCADLREMCALPQIGVLLDEFGHV